MAYVWKDITRTYLGNGICMEGHNKDIFKAVYICGIHLLENDTTRRQFICTLSTRIITNSYDMDYFNWFSLHLNRFLFNSNTLLSNLKSFTIDYKLRVFQLIIP